MNKKTKLWVALGIIAAGGIMKVWAVGIPTQTPLAYSGVLQDSAGNPITTSQSIQLTLWDDATANASANQRCTTPTQTVTPDSQGRFRIVLDQACFGAVQAHPDLWVQLQVGSTVLPRSKINVVPFAIEAGKATRVVLQGTTNGADGGIRTTVDGIYCGATGSTTGAISAQAGALNGYRAAKYLCEQTCASATAHMCTGDEAVRSHELGVNVPGGWMKSSTGLHYTIGGGGTGQLFNCYGWTNGTRMVSGYTQFGGYFDLTVGGYGSHYCDVTFPILCCD